MSSSEHLADPRNRFLRFEPIEARGKTVIYRCIDSEESTQADWNEINVLNVPPEKINELKSYLKKFSSVVNRNIITIHRAWIDSERNMFIYISEIFSKKTLRNYLKEVSHLPTSQVIGRWVHQIMSGLEYLHNFAEGPLIHNNLHCKNIFIDASEGVIKIGTPNLEAILFDSNPAPASNNCTGELLSVKNDIWCLGLCVVEVATGEVISSDSLSSSSPKENASPVQLPPQILQITDPTIVDFVFTCLTPFKARPDINQLRETTLFSRRFKEREELIKRHKQEKEKMMARHEKEIQEMRILYLKEMQERRNLIMRAKSAFK